jgi:hypothetical protein
MFDREVSFSYKIRYNTDDTVIFSSFGGSSWHRADANFIFWVSYGLFLKHFMLTVEFAGR